MTLLGWRAGLRAVAREAVSVVAIAGLLASSWWRGRWPIYTQAEIDPILLLFALFVTINGIENTGAMARVSAWMEGRRGLPTKLVLSAFAMSLWVTIDVSLVVLIPMVMAMNLRRREPLVILVALSAHLGAAMTPFGTPQNLFLFRWYGVDVATFVAVIAPFSLGLLALLLLASLGVRVEAVAAPTGDVEPVRPHHALIWFVLFLVVVLCVLRVLPVAAALLVAPFALLLDRASLRVDYALLVTFLCFLGLADNLREPIAAWLPHPRHVFVTSALLSQLISNVPTTLLLMKSTPAWQALLWGGNVGGFGSPVAAMANLIALRLYLSHPNRCSGLGFAWRFTLAGTLLFVAGIGLYLLIEDMGWFPAAAPPVQSVSSIPNGVRR